MARINFKGQAQKQRRLKRSPSKYKESAGRPNISMSPGVAPAYPAVPYKYLPVNFQDVNTQDWVVMPKGRLASMVLSTNTAWDADWQTGNMGGIKDDAGNFGAITVGDDSYYGVSKNIKGLLVPCNGGNKVTYDYGADDALTVPSADSPGSMVAASGDSFDLGANAPVGAMEHDVYQDIRGANLNYDMRNKNWGVLAQQFIKIPCIDVGAWNSFSAISGLFVADSAGSPVSVSSVATVSDTSGLAAGTDLTFVVPAHTDADSDDTYTIDALSDDDGVTWLETGFTINGLIATVAAAQFLDDATIIARFVFTDPDAASDAPSLEIASSSAFMTANAGYAAANKGFSFLTFNSEKAGHGLAGGLLKSDCFGNWMHESGNPQTAGRTAQTVGRLLGVDYRFEKDLLDTVQSRFEDDAQYAVAGTGTYGVPQYLYNFAYLAMNNAGWTIDGSEANTIKAACDAGVFGEAWIQLNCQ